MYRLYEDNPAELECQFILRLPSAPAEDLRTALRTGANLRDRLSIKIENDVRHGEVRLDNWLLHGKVVDLPTMIESLKTIDTKSFYKTADICQMLLCKEDDDQTTDEEAAGKSKKKDPNKVDKKFLWPHGVTPPTKNVRRRRFRKTLKKKYVEAPEIEKEVKRLLRVDNDAASVKWEVMNEDEEHTKHGKAKTVKKERDTTQSSDVSLETNNQNSFDVAEHEIFGGAVSDTDDEETNINVELDDNSKMSADDSRLSDSNSIPNMSHESRLVTEFCSEMFEQSTSHRTLTDIKEEVEYSYYEFESQFDTDQMSNETLMNRLEELESQLTDLKNRHMQKELEMENIENPSLRQRFQEILSQLTKEMFAKEQEQEKISRIIKSKIKDEK